MIKQLLSRMKVSNFVRSAGLLAGGTAVGQLVAFAASPLLTRLFAPEDFGVLALYTSILSILAVVADLRYSLAIPLPKDEDDALALLTLSVVTILVFAGLTGLTLLLGQEMFARVLGLDVPVIEAWVWLLPLGLIATAGYSALTYWAARRRVFRRIASTRMVQSIGQTSAQLGFGLLSIGQIGLALGDALGRVLGIGSLLRLVLRDGSLGSLSVSRVSTMAVRYRRFPLIATFSSLLNMLGHHIPSIALLIMYGPAAAGFYALSQRVVGAPVRLVSSSVSLVYYEEAARLTRDQPNGVRRLFRQTTARLFLIAAAPAAILVAVGPAAFSYVFGESWAMAGEFTRILAMVFVSQLAVTTVSQTLNVIGRNELQLAWNSLRLLFVLAVFLLAHTFTWSASQAVMAYSVVVATAYGLLWLTIDRVLRSPRSFTNGSESNPDG